jgi:ABC-type glutathione transport system ATPase component
LSPVSLSSGEQHKLVLTYELLFRVQRDALILIDEPELSLHVTWQHRFLDDLLRISEIATLDFLIATHAPQVIHKRTDLALELGS